MMSGIIIPTIISILTIIVMIIIMIMVIIVMIGMMISIIIISLVIKTLVIRWWCECGLFVRIICCIFGWVLRIWIAAVHESFATLHFDGSIMRRLGWPCQSSIVIVKATVVETIEGWWRWIHVAVHVCKKKLFVNNFSSTFV